MCQPFASLSGSCQVITAPTIKKAAPLDEDDLPLASLALRVKKPVASSASGAGSSGDRIKIPDRAIELAEAREMIPRCKGCVLALNKEIAWEVKYPRAIAPRSHSVTFDRHDDGASRSALMKRLVWVWRRHREVDPDAVCPYDLGVAI